MITYVNKSNTADYSFLYSEVSELLRTHDNDGNAVAKGSDDAVLRMEAITLTEETYEPDRYFIKEGNEYVMCSDDTFDSAKSYFRSDTITSLDELFSYMRNIATIAPRYTRLPLDEDVFTIDANSRVITVPPAFAKNGISVQGDEVSEIVYFKIDRYYDATDLYGDLTDGSQEHPMQIFIQWKTPSGAEGVSKPWVIDVESEPGYIIFGWPLSSKITENAGQVEFSVRFYRYNKEDKKLVYSLSTLSQKASIKPALDYDLCQMLSDNAGIDDSTGLVFDRFVNSPYLGDTSIKAVKPEFLENYKLPLTMNMAEDSNGFHSVAVQFPVEATVTDAGQLSYFWRKYNIFNTSQKEAIDYAITEIKTKDAAPITGKLYYFKTDAGALSLITTSALANYATGFEKNDDNEFVTSDQRLIYERVSQALIDSVGHYYAVATNRVRNTTNQAHTPVRMVDGVEESAYCVVPMPQTPVYETGRGELPKTAIIEKEKNYVLTLDCFAKSPDADGKMTYKWYISDSGEEGSFTPINDVVDEEGNVTNSSVNKSFVIAGEYLVGESTLDEEGHEVPGEILGPKVVNGVASGDAYYKVIATNNLNRVSKETDPAQPFAQATLDCGVCRVTHRASIPVIRFDSNRYATIAGLQSGEEGLKIKVDMDALAAAGEKRTADDSVTYQWYRYFQGTGNWEGRDRAALENGTYVVNDDEAMDGADTDTFFPGAAGYYFCQVTNTYNGTQAVKCSSFFTVSEV